jgi:hypothetical protein
MTVKEGQFTGVDTTGTVIDCIAEKLDLRGAQFYTWGTYTAGSVFLEHNPIGGAAGYYNLVTAHTAADTDQITVAAAHCRIRTDGTFSGTVNWKLVIPERSEVHPD